MYLLRCVWYSLDDSSTAGPRLSNRPRNLNLLPKQLIGLSAWMEAQIISHARRRQRLNLCVCCSTPQLSGYVQWPKTLPPNWPSYLPVLAGLSVWFPEDVFLWACQWVWRFCWGDHRNLNFTIRHRHLQRPSLHVTSCLDHFQEAPPAFLNPCIRGDIFFSEAVCEQEMFLLCNGEIQMLFCFLFQCLHAFLFLLRQGRSQERGPAEISRQGHLVSASTCLRRLRSASKFGGRKHIMCTQLASIATQLTWQ